MKKRHRNKSAACRRTLLATGIAAALALPTTVWAQTANASLHGMATANSVVTAKNLATGAIRHTTAGGDGRYTLPGLPPGTYQVDAGAGTEHTVTVTVASSVTLDLVAADAAAAEGTLAEIVVKSRHPVEVTTSEIATTITQREIEVTPQLTRNFLEFADTVPGMSFQVDGKGNTSIHSGAQDTSSINVYIDGVGQKNYVRSGGISGQAGGGASGSSAVGDPGNPFPQLAIGEYQVITSNYKAEYDQISGAAITAVTKSGTNEFHGEVFGNYSNEKLRNATPSENATNSPKARAPSEEYGASLGGPIIQDKLHFFITYEGKTYSVANSVQPPSVPGFAGGPVDVTKVLPASLLSQYGPTTNPFSEHLFFGKLDWEVSDRDRLELSLKYRKESQTLGAAGQTAASAAYDYENDDTRVDLRWQHSADGWLNETLVTYENTLDLPKAKSGNSGQAYIWSDPSSFFTLIQVNGQSPNTYFQAKQKGIGLQDDLTFSELHWLGDHTVKSGVKFKDLTLDGSDASSAAVYYYYVTSKGVDPNPFQVQWGDKVVNGAPIVAESKNRQFGLYTQDDWAITRRLIVNAGIRYDFEQTPGYTDFRPQPNVLASLLGPDARTPAGATPHTYAQTLALGGININDYIGNGHNRKNPGNEFQPRLGFSFDMDGEEKHVIFGGAGRAYDRNVFEVLQKEATRAVLAQPTVQFVNASAPPGAGCNAGALSATCTTWDPSYLTPAGLQQLGLTSGATGEVQLINNHLKAPYSDQFSIGMRNKVGDWNTSATISRINSYDGLVARLGNHFWDGGWYEGGQAWGGGGAPGIGNLFLFDNGKKTQTTQVLLSAIKPYSKESGWYTTVAYTFSRAVQNVHYFTDYQFDYASIKDAPLVDSEAVPRHRLVVSGGVDVPWGVTLAAKLTLETVRPYFVADGCGKNVCTGSSPGPYNDIAQYLKGEQFLFGGPIFGYRDIDVQASKTFAMPWGGEFQVRLDVLNLFNFKNFDSSGPVDPWPAPAYFNKTGAIVGVTRTGKLSVNYRF